MTSPSAVQDFFIVSIFTEVTRCSPILVLHYAEDKNGQRGEKPTLYCWT